MTMTTLSRARAGRAPATAVGPARVPAARACSGCRACAASPPTGERRHKARGLLKLRAYRDIGIGSWVLDPNNFGSDPVFCDDDRIPRLDVLQSSRLLGTGRARRFGNFMRRARHLRTSARA
jgi:hypothetical protein